MKFVYVRRLMDGATLDLPEKDLEATLKRGGFEYIGEVITSFPSSETPAPKIEIADTFECIICGFIAKNNTGLARHKTTH